MTETMRRANNAKSKIRARIEHMFAELKGSEEFAHQNYRDRPSDDQDRNGRCNTKFRSKKSTAESADLRHAENYSLIEPSKLI
jgi:hypothetical protein